MDYSHSLFVGRKTTKGKKENDKPFNSIVTVVVIKRWSVNTKLSVWVSPYFPTNRMKALLMAAGSGI